MTWHLWLVGALVLILWIAYWGGCTVWQATRRGYPNDTVGREFRAFLLGGTLGPLGLAIARYRGGDSLWGSGGHKAGRAAVAAVLNPFRWPRGRVWLAQFKKKKGQLLQAIKQRDTATVRAILDAGTSPDTRFKNGQTALMAAVAQHGNLEVVSMLLEAGADIDATDFKKPPNTPLTTAAGYAFYGTDALEALVAAGATAGRDRALRGAARSAFRESRAMGSGTGAHLRAYKKAFQLLRESGAGHGDQYCASCLLNLRPFERPSGSWSGTVTEFLALPTLRPENGFICEKCSEASCPKCSGKLAGERGVRQFICTACGHAPLRTIYRSSRN